MAVEWRALLKYTQLVITQPVSHVNPSCYHILYCVSRECLLCTYLMRLYLRFIRWAPSFSARSVICWSWSWLTTASDVIVHPRNYVANLPLQWRHDGRGNASNHQPRDCLLNNLFRRRSKKTSKLRVTGICEGNSPVTDGFLAQMASDAENVSIWWRHHAILFLHFVVISCQLILPVSFRFAAQAVGISTNASKTILRNMCEMKWINYKQQQ